MTDRAPARELGLGFLGIGQAVARIFQQYPDMSSLPYRVVAAADPGRRRWPASPMSSAVEHIRM